MDRVDDFQLAFSLTAQVQNAVFVPQGDQYGTDTGDNSGSIGSHGILCCN
jgi:hypothetical protein